MNGTSRIEINLRRIDHNVETIRSLIGPHVGLCGVVKADGYGLGIRRIAHRLEQLGVDLLAVYTPDQARDLIEAGIHTDILILMPMRRLDRVDSLYRHLIQGRLHCTVHDASHLSDLEHIACRFGCVIPVHVEIDTGMSRGGLTEHSASQVIGSVMRDSAVRLAGVMTHFASADVDPDATVQQLCRFQRVINALPSPLPEACVLHAGSTHATLRDRNFHLDMVRIGVGWVGYGPEAIECEPPLVQAPELQPILRWTSQIVHVKSIEEGQSVGYGGTWEATRPTRIGLVPVGYADGYPLALSNRGVVRVAGSDGTWHHAPVVGRISMDQMTIDLTDMPASVGIVGATVELFGDEHSQPTHIPRLARQAGTLVYDLLCGLSPRIRRHYGSRKASVAAAPAAPNPSESGRSPVVHHPAG